MISDMISCADPRTKTFIAPSRWSSSWGWTKFEMIRGLKFSSFSETFDVTVFFAGRMAMNLENGKLRLNNEDPRWILHEQGFLLYFWFIIIIIKIQKE